MNMSALREQISKIQTISGFIFVPKNWTLDFKIVQHFSVNGRIFEIFQSYGFHLMNFMLEFNMAKILRV